MSDFCSFRMILHFSDFNRNYFLKLFNKKSKIKGSEITFEIPKEKFNQFQSSMRKKICFLSTNGKIEMNYTINLLKEKNTYHLLSMVGEMELYELLFYDEDKIELIVDGKEIKEYDTISKFKRYSLINIKNYNIQINGKEINIEEFKKSSSLTCNSYQLSFYDIQEKLIVSKIIKPVQDANFSNFYEKYNLRLINFSSDIDELKKNKDEFKENAKELYEKSLLFFSEITKKINLNLPKNKLKEIINENNHLEFFFNFIKLRIFFIFYLIINGEFDELLQTYKYIEGFFEKLKNDNECENYEKVSILFFLAQLLSELKSSQFFLESNFHYINVNKAKNNSAIKLSIEFIDKYINNLNEESPQYFKLVEIDSGIGDYQGENIFTFDMIDINELKYHLKEAIPNIFCFYSKKNNSKHLAFTSSETIGICVNETKLFEHCEKFKVDEDCYEERKFDVKNIAMKLSTDIFHESFGHIKFQIHHDFSYQKINSTPTKCFDNKILKRLAGVNEPIRNNTINILPNPGKSDSGNYLESSLGKLPGSAYYTSVYLQRLKNIGNLLDHPELFYNKDKLEILQKYVFYKYLYENNSGKIKGKKEEKEKYQTLNFENELDYLTKFFLNNQKVLTPIKEEKSLDTISDTTKLNRKILKIKKGISNTKNNDEPNNITKGQKKKYISKIIYPKLTDKNKILNIILSKKTNIPKKNYYLKMLFDILYKD